MNADLASRRDRVLDIIRRNERIIVALSGGVDSAVLLALAIEALGRDRVLAVTGRSESLSDEEISDAGAVAALLGARHIIVDTREMERDGYRRNEGDRCYHCRTELFEVLSGVARREGGGAIAYGAIADDLDDVRPGMRAAGEHGILAPLLEAGLTKRDVRALARDRGLPVRDKPASACLASRIPAGTSVTPEKLAQIGRAESALKRLGIEILRVRHHGEIARIETNAAGEDRLRAPGIREAAIRAVRDAGFLYVTLDIAGYRPAGTRDAPGPAGGLYRIGPSRDSGQ